MNGHDERLQSAVRAVGRFLMSAEGRRLLAINGFSGQQIVPADENESVGTVLLRLSAYSPPVLVAVHYPDREGERRFSLIELGASSSATYVDPSPVGVDSTIGMFADALSGRETVQFSFEGSQASAMRFKTLIDA